MFFSHYLAAVQLQSVAATLLFLSIAGAVFVGWWLCQNYAGWKNGGDRGGILAGVLSIAFFTVILLTGIVFGGLSWQAGGIAKQVLTPFIETPLLGSITLAAACFLGYFAIRMERYFADDEDLKDGPPYTRYTATVPGTIVRGLIAASVLAAFVVTTSFLY